MAKLGKILLLTAVFGIAAGNVQAQQRDQTSVIDSIAVRGADRSGRAAVISRINIALGQPVGFLDVQRAVEALYATGQYADVKVLQATIEGKEVLLFEVVERAILGRWDVEGTSKLPERSVRGKVRLLAGRPFNPADVSVAVSAIDSLYKKEGYYQTRIESRVLPQDDGRVNVVFSVKEGSRVAVSRVIIEGNEAFEAGEIVKHMNTRPEGFLWFKKGEYDEQELLRDVRERLPAFYASHGYIDFQVLRDTLVVNEGTGKGTIIVSVDEGEQYGIGTFEILGNREFTREQLVQFYPFGEDRGSGGLLGLGGGKDESAFDMGEWAAATGEVHSLYWDNGYIRAQVQDVMSRRTRTDGSRVVDLRWQIREGAPAIVSRIKIVGNTITHEDVIRRAIFMVPGDVFRRSMLIRSYQSISNLGFFEQPLPVPFTEPANQQGDVDVIFTVKERRTGNVNFGASVGQGTGVGGFIGMEEPNLFGKGKRIKFQLQFGSNLSDFSVTYTDPAIRGSLISGSLRLHNTRQRFTIADLGRITTRGGSVQLGFPLFGSRFTRVLGSYLLEQSDFDSPQTLLSVFRCSNCVLSSASISVVRDTRVGLPFATGGTMHQFALSQNGGPLGGSGNFRRATFEGRWYAPLSQADLQLGLGGMQFLLGFTAKTGFVWGDAGPHFRQLFSMGGTQFGIPLRGYDEFSITPNGFDPTASGSRASGVNAFGASYAAFTGEIGLRLSQMLYLNTFLDAGNVWATAGQYNPTRLFRGAGLGVSVVSPLGPIGLDYAYGFDRLDLAGNPDPGWQLHFKLGNFF
ncbi:MAG: outer membrane protein assembly factor BamA [Gemmatimonadetes bacterium]|nr:outer membrane protein assembly factor BamA [Gemmatimonadota bacterium]